MVKADVQIVRVAYAKGTKRIIAVGTIDGAVLTVDEVRKLIDDNIVVTAVSPDGNVTTVTKRDETMIQAVRDDSKENNLDSLEEFDLNKTIYKHPYNLSDILKNLNLKRYEPPT